jgi:hypothetical protein
MNKKGSFTGIIILTFAVIIHSPGIRASTWSFSPDSVCFPDKNYQYGYQGLSVLNINSEFSLPVRSLYLETSQIITEDAFYINQEDQAIIGTIPAEKTFFEEIATEFAPAAESLPGRPESDFSNGIYDIQKIQTGGRLIWIVTILPIIVDSQYNIILNRTIALDSTIAIRNELGKHDLLSNIGAKIASDYPFPSAKANSQSGVPLGCEYVIITNDTLAEAFEDLAQFRNATGISSGVALTDSIYERYAGVDKPEKIKNYLKDFHQSGGRYVLFGGDNIIVPVRYVYYYNTSAPPSNAYYLMPSDLYYADLDGQWEVDGDGVWGEPTDDTPDLVPELVVGRLPLRKVESAEKYISKLINYATDPGNGDFDYLTKSLFFSSDEMRDYPADGQHGVIAQELPEHIYVDTVSGVEALSGKDPSPINDNGQTCINTISEGFGFIHIIAHGRIDGFIVKSSGYGNAPSSMILTAQHEYNHGSVGNIEKNDKSSLYYSLACAVGGFDLDSVNGDPTDWSLVERLIAAEASGAVGMVAYSRWGWVYSSYFLQKSFTKNLYGQANGNPALAMAYSWLEYPYYRDLIYGQNYFGDPAQKIYLDRPEKMNLDVRQSADTYSVSVTHIQKGIGETMVTLSLNGDILERGMTDETGCYDFATNLNYGDEYVITAVKDGFTVARKFYSPSMSLDADEEENALPAGHRLDQNFPNPFNPVTIIPYNLGGNSDMVIDIINVLGQQIKTFKIDGQSSGNHTITWDGITDHGDKAPSGIYFYRMQTGDFQQTRKMVLVK